MGSLDEYVNKVFPHDGVFEVILGTSGVKENLAPIGIIKSSNIYYSKIYKDTLTYSNLKKKDLCTINITLDPIVFYELLFDEGGKKPIYEGIPYLNESLSFLSRCKEIEKYENFSVFKYEFVKVINSNFNFRAFSRSDSLLIDLLVHITRLDIYSKEELEKYLPIIEYEVKTIARLSPNLQHVVKDLLSRINAKGLKISL